MVNHLEILFNQIEGEITCVYCGAFYTEIPKPNGNGWHEVRCEKCGSTIHYDSSLLVFEHIEMNSNVALPDEWYGRECEFTPTKKDVFELGAYLHQIALEELEEESQDDGLIIAESDLESWTEIEGFLISHSSQFTIMFYDDEESESETKSEITSAEPISVQ